MRFVIFHPKLALPPPPVSKCVTFRKKLRTYEMLPKSVEGSNQIEAGEHVRSMSGFKGGKFGIVHAWFKSAAHAFFFSPKWCRFLETCQSCHACFFYPVDPSLLVPGPISRKSSTRKFRSTQPATFIFFAQTVEQTPVNMSSLVVTLKNCPKLAFRSLLFADLCASWIRLLLPS